MRIPALLLALACAFPTPALAFEAQGRLSLGPAWDSNATRAAAGGSPVADEALRLAGDVEARTAPGSRLSAAAGYRGGLDDFRSHGDADRGAHDLFLSTAYRASAWLAPGLEGRLRLRHAGDGLRDAADGSAAATLEAGPFSGALSTLRLGWRDFRYAAAAHAFHGPFAGIAVRWEPFRHHLLGASYEVGVRAYPGGTAFRNPSTADERFLWPDRRPVEPPPDPGSGELEGPGELAPDPGLGADATPARPDYVPSVLGRRHDLAHAAAITWTWRGPAILGGGYTFSRVDSNGYGLDTDRHRLHLLAGLRLPAGLVGSGEAALQLVRFPDGIYLADELLLLDDEENLSSLSLQLSKPLGEGLSAEVRYAGYVGEFRAAGVRYERHVAGTALTYRF